MGQIVYTIYCHIHIASGRRYIGLTKKTMLQRWNQHVYTSTVLTKKGWSHFANAIRKYGKDAFSHEVLEVCYSLEVANLAEECWIELFESQNPEFGFNVKKGGDHRPHPITNPWYRPGYPEKAMASLAKANAALTPEMKSANSKAMWQDPQTRQKIIESNQAGWTAEKRDAAAEASRVALADPETKQKVVESLQARVWTEESRQKVSQNRTGKKASPETRARISASSKSGTPESRAKVSVESKERWSDPEFQEKHRASNRSSDPEVRAKIAESARAFHAHRKSGTLSS